MHLAKAKLSTALPVVANALDSNAIREPQRFFASFFLKK